MLAPVGADLLGFLRKKYDLRFVEKDEENDIYDDSSATAFSFDASFAGCRERRRLGVNFKFATEAQTIGEMKRE